MRQVLADITFTTRVAAEHNLSLVGPKDPLEELIGVKILWRPVGALYPTKSADREGEYRVLVVRPHVTLEPAMQ
jgi:hypothetical protein